MRGVRDDLAVLGLKPGANRRAIDDAFKTLMKQHHPDRPGGDGARAAEIIRAYRALRPGAMVAQDIEFQHQARSGSAWWGWLGLGCAAAAGATALALMIDDTPRTGPARIGQDVAKELGLSASIQPDLAEQPLNEAAIDRAVDEARALAAGRDEMDLARRSRECHLAFRSSRELERFDGCVAFDNAVVLLQDRDPMRDQGPFQQVSVSRRHWSAASLLSTDSLAIDSRLDRIRLAVELRLAPVEPEPEPEANEIETAPEEVEPIVPML